MQKLSPDDLAILKPGLVIGLWSRFIILGGSCIYLIYDVWNKIQLHETSLSLLLIEGIAILLIIFLIGRFFFLTESAKILSCSIWGAIGVFLAIGIAMRLIYTMNVPGEIIWLSR